ncbi:MAG: phosphate signaling complex protein PhoU [Bacteroidales bacterium]|nr:phosphate signaling complex protein PhoU [Bacteroidales bacterium]
MMKHTEKELESLKDEVNEMWRLVISQCEKAKEAFLNSDIELAREIISREKRVDAFDLKIDSDCENYIALFAPVAIDLRLVLSILKISNTLERIADFAEGIAAYVIGNDCNGHNPEIIEDLQIEKMFSETLSMLSDSYVALESENTKVAGKILAKDDEIDGYYHKAIDVLTNYLQAHPDYIRCGLKLMLLIRKLERIGDHCSNIVEEIVFYIDAKVLKHGIVNK